MLTLEENTWCVAYYVVRYTLTVSLLGGRQQFYCTNDETVCGVHIGRCIVQTVSGDVYKVCVCTYMYIHAACAHTCTCSVCTYMHM